MAASMAALAAALVVLAGCAGGQPAQVPLSGITGPDGGSEEAIHYDGAGRARFYN